MHATVYPTPALARFRRLAASAAVLALSVGMAWAAGNGWVWVDASGRKIYSDMPPPPAVSDKHILQRPGQPRPAVVDQTETAAPAKPASPRGQTAPAPTKEDPVALKKKREQDQAAEEARKLQEAKNADIRADNCKRAQSQQAMLQSGVRMHTMGPQGEPLVYDDAMRAKEMARMQQVIADNCR